MWYADFLSSKDVKNTSVSRSSDVCKSHTWEIPSHTWNQQYFPGTRTFGSGGAVYILWPTGLTSGMMVDPDWWRGSQLCLIGIRVRKHCSIDSVNFQIFFNSKYIHYIPWNIFGRYFVEFGELYNMYSKS